MKSSRSSSRTQKACRWQTSGNPRSIALVRVTITRFYYLLNRRKGITPLAYVPPRLPMKNSEWPTLGEMIDSGKRVVVFLDSGADPSKVNFILPEFDMVSPTTQR